MKNININAIRIDGGTQSRASLNESVVSEYAEDLLALPPVVLFHDGSDYWLADGFHRYHAFRKASKASIPADVRTGTQREATLFSVGANQAHGLRRTNDDKRRAVNTLLNDAEWAGWSDRRIAEVCGVGHPFVAALRSPVVAEKQKESRNTSAAKKANSVESDSTQTADKPTKPAPKPEATPPAIENDGMLTSDELVAEMQETQAENEQLQERVALMAKDDKAAEIDKLLTRINGLEGRLHQAMNQIKASEDTTKVHAALIHKLRKLLGVEGHKAIYAAVSALVAERAEA